MSMIKYQPPKGTRDILLDDAAFFRKTLDSLKKQFRLFGFCDMETPAFENIETLIRKSGSIIEEEIYNFHDKADRALGLIFEFTASLARVLASKPEIPRPFKRYQVGKVWRYEAPQANRYREFFQADIDIIGPKSMDCELEILCLVSHILNDFKLNDFTIILYNRKILKAQMDLAGVSEGNRFTVLRGLDKLDKIGWEKVKEYVLENGVSEKEFEGLKGLIPENNSNNEILDELRSTLKDINLGREGIEELEQILTGTQHLGIDKKIKLCPTLVRGLDYYTGPIFEVRSNVLKNVSFGGGGRYDDLIKLFGGTDEGAVGFAFGVDRLVSVLSDQRLIRAGKSPAKSIVLFQNDNLIQAAHKLAYDLRSEEVPVFLYVGNKKLGKQLSYASKMGFKYAILVGEEEVASDNITVRNMDSGMEEKIKRSDLSSYIGIDES